MNNDSSIAVDGVTKKFGQGKDEVVALDCVSVAIRENEFFTLLGPSGCGKTTLLRLIAGFEHPSDGNIYLHGNEISHLPPFRRPVNTVFQNYALFPHMTVAENIGFGLSMQDKAQDEIDRTVAEMLELVQMSALRDRKTDQISGGQQQRVALARALAPKPRVLLLDEPLSALDYKLRKGMQLELKRLQHETGITFIFVTHDQEEALTMSDRIAVMRSGEILQVGTPHEIYDHPQKRFVADFIGDTNFLDAEVVSAAGSGRALTLGNGVNIETNSIADADAETGTTVTVALRPEQCRLVNPGTSGALQGSINDVVYSGTDTHFHITLDSGAAFVVRTQNNRAGEESWTEGSGVGIQFAPDAVQVLKD